jgi:hypothetical protein
MGKTASPHFHMGKYNPNKDAFDGDEVASLLDLPHKDKDGVVIVSRVVKAKSLSDLAAAIEQRQMKYLRHGK